ncbi:hypothetical protein HA1_03929 [Clostridium perfringens F262]|uniref:Uncharacterized protein n=1 Tax=Clostridium perfringens F262 TaxID=883064 RepID=A0AAV3FF96_CLOPF|nr:hypothetical protein HA1_03929 [Clostridium perfringens F262]
MFCSQFAISSELNPLKSKAETKDIIGHIKQIVEHVIAIFTI